MRDELWTVGKLAEAGAEVLTRRGIEGARLDADLLLAEALGLRRIELYTRYDMPVDEADRVRFREYVKRRAGREPVAYILGRREFWEHSFRVRPGVLVPRPETELLVELGGAALAARAEGAAPPLVVDLGVGSGCVVISLLKLVPEARAIGVDLSPEALAVAAENAAELGVADRLELRRADFLAGLGADERGRVDLLVSNPPYIARDEAADLPPDVRDHEPEMALFSPSDPLHFHRLALAAHRDWLATDGCLLLEMGVGGGTALEADAAGRFPGGTTGCVRDLAGRERVFVAGAASLPSAITERFVVRGR
ncbi:MAG: peptide chain release factor N(5)-glutamine methyltransferase [Planctomycetota bacterium]